ncbi:hypothetical protein WJX81_004229 [Elliptochloris bilobata]|uniref:Uncharacterized protein n=1 Tax=Elliptochloris bilobata TaxID=381761 RepID=A0AAW1R1B3_9CHLO
MRHDQPSIAINTLRCWRKALGPEGIAGLPGWVHKHGVGLRAAIVDKVRLKLLHYIPQQAQAGKIQEIMKPASQEAVHVLGPSAEIDVLTNIIMALFERAVEARVQQRAMEDIKATELSQSMLDTLEQPFLVTPGCGDAAPVQCPNVERPSRAYQFAGVGMYL